MQQSPINLLYLIYVRYCTVHRPWSTPTAHGNPHRVAIIFSRVGVKGTAESLLPLDLVRPLICCSISDLLCDFQTGNTYLRAFRNTAICANARSHRAYNPRCSVNFFKAVNGVKAGAGSYSGLCLLFRLAVLALAQAR